ncbi:MAG: transposase [Ruminococcus sp.]|nr:transposase [Ruminococcus sp.]
MKSSKKAQLYLLRRANRKSKRQQVKFFVSNVRRTYADSASVWFTNATQIIDKSHWIRQAIWAFENVRKKEQKKLGANLRKYSNVLKGCSQNVLTSFVMKKSSKSMLCYIIL